MQNSLLAISLSSAVPLHMEELKKRGGPTEEDFKFAQEFSSVLGSKGDCLLYKSDKKGETADLFNKTARSIAILSFMPGGVSLFGCHWEAE